MRVFRRTRQGQQKLTEEEVGQIKRMLEDGYSHRTIADTFGCSRRFVSYINEGKYWKDIEASAPNES